MNKKLKEFFKPQVLILLVVILIAGLVICNSSRTIDNYHQNEIRLLNLLRSDKSRVYGRACGVLSDNTAKLLLQSNDVIRQEYASGVGLDGITGSGGLGGEVEDSFAWNDSCSYQSESNSLDYVQLSITTHSTIEYASEAFKTVLPKVNQSENINPSEYGDELLYDAGVYYLLRNNQVIIVSANKSVAPTSQGFVKSVFEQLIAEI